MALISATDFQGASHWAKWVWRDLQNGDIRQKQPTLQDVKRQKRVNVLMLTNPLAEQLNKPSTSGSLDSYIALLFGLMYWADLFFIHVQLFHLVLVNEMISPLLGSFGPSLLQRTDLRGLLRAPIFFARIFRLVIDCDARGLKTVNRSLPPEKSLKISTRSYDRHPLLENRMETNTYTESSKLCLLPAVR